jgi:hypothetical protein
MSDPLDDEQGRAPGAAHGSGRAIIRLGVAGTAVFTAAVAVAAPLRAERWVQVMVAVVSIALFAVGVVLSLWAYASALERSRIDEIGVANLYLLTGRTAPSAVRRTLSIALGVQVVVALVGAVVGLSGLEGNDLNALAFGVLVPMLGVGVNGFWAVRHGSFGPRLTGGSTVRGRGID